MAHFTPGPIPHTVSDQPCLDFINSEFADHTGTGRLHDRLTLGPWRSWFLQRCGLTPDESLQSGTLAELARPRSLLRSLLQPGPELGGGLVTSKCLADAGDNATGMLGDIPLVDPNQTPAGRTWLAGYRKSNPRPEDLGRFTAPAYTATAILLAVLVRAIDASGGRLPARAEVLTQVAATSSFPSPLGTLSFDTSGDVTPQVVSLYDSRRPTPDEAAAAPSCIPDRSLCWVFRQQLTGTVGD